MVTPILLPKQGNTVESCLILEWKKKKGEEVKQGEVICEIETDKAVFEIEAPSDGFILETFFDEGDDVPVLTNIAVVGNKGESYDEHILGSNKSNISENNEEDLSISQGVTEGGLVIPSEAKESQSSALRDERLLPPDEIGGRNDNSEHPTNKKGISPRAKKLAEKLKLPVDNIKGTGPGNRIVEKDVLEASKHSEPLTLAARDLIDEGKTRPETGSGIGNRVTAADLKNKTQTQKHISEESIKVVPLKGIRKLIAERMLASLQNSAQLTLNSSADAAALLNLRKRFKSSTTYKEFQSVTINDLVQYAVIKTLPQHPEMNSLLIGDNVEYHNRINIGFAVDTPRGLMVPVIKNSQDLNLLQVSSEAKRLAEASISGKIDTKELNGATFTITNLGSFGIESFTPVLNLPQTAILGINTIALKPVEKGSGVEFIPHISFSLTIDHRVLDGAVGARFLQDLGKTITEIDLAVTMGMMRG